MRRPVFLLAVVMLAACTRVPTAASPQDMRPVQNVPIAVNLFTAAPATPEIDTARDVGVVRHRYVGVDFAVLSASVPGRTFRLNLFDDVTLTAIVDHIEASGASSATASGRVEGGDGGWTFVASDGVLIGSITTPAAQYQVRYAGNGVHAVRQFDPSQLPSERPPVNPARRPPGDH